MENQLKEMSFEDFVVEYDNVSFTENGAVGKMTTKSALLDLNFKVSSLRDRTEEYIVESFVKAYYEDHRYAVKWFFCARYFRGAWRAPYISCVLKVHGKVSSGRSQGDYEAFEREA